MIKARTLAFSILAAIATPTIAWGDAEDELECEMLVRRGDDCVEYVWEEGNEIVKGDWCPQDPRTFIFVSSCKCNRDAYQDFGFGERTEYYWCKARY